MTDEQLLEVMGAAADAVRRALDGLDDWGLAGTRPGQYHSDLVADAAARAVLEDAGLGVVSEESGVHHAERAVTVVLDPVDGSTNASRALPWFSTSLCALDAGGLRAALVANQVTGERFEAVQGGGARRDGRPVGPSACASMGTALVGLSGWPPTHLGWRQVRVLGASSLDLCAVATGRLDAFIDCSVDAHHPWDYLGALLVCREAGALVVDAHGRELVTDSADARRTPVAAATPSLLQEAVLARARLG